MDFIFLVKQDFLNVIREHNDSIETYGQTQYKTMIDNKIVKLYGDLTNNHHDWVVVNHQDWHVLCHIICLLEYQVKKSFFPVGTVTGSGVHAICHFVNQDVFSDLKPTDSMHDNGTWASDPVNEICFLVKGWAKYTSEIINNNVPQCMPMPVMVMFPASCIVSTCSGTIEDSLHAIPHSYIFCPQEINGQYC